jgi:putative endonuclease
LSDIWYVYIIKATDGRLYTGVTIDMQRRWSEHCGNSGTAKKGAKFFWGRKPESLVFLLQSENRSAACKEEAAIKKLARKHKILLIESDRNELSEYPELAGIESEKLGYK